MTTGGAEVDEKMFLPEPEYTSASVTSIACICSDGSYCAAVVPTLLAEVSTAAAFVTAPIELDTVAGPLVVFLAGDLVTTATGAGGGGASGVRSWRYP